MDNTPPRLAINQFTTKPQTFEQDLDAYEAAGHCRIELCTAKLSDDGGNARDQLHHLRDRGFTLSSVQPAVHSVFPDRMAAKPKDPEDRLDRYRRDIDRVKEVFPDFPGPFVVITGVAPSLDFEAAQRTLREVLPPLANFAAEQSIRLAFEPIHPYFMQQDTFLYSLDEAQRLLDDISRNNVGLVFDLFHMWQEIDLPDRIKSLNHPIEAVHVGDWPTGGPRHLDDRAIPGDGQIDLPVLIAALRSAGYDGPWVLELLSDRSLEHSLWKMDPQEVIRRSQVGFSEAWNAASKRMHATAGTPVHEQNESRSPRG